MNNKQNSHIKADTIKWIIVFTSIVILAAAIVLGVFSSGFTNWDVKTWFGNGEQTEQTSPDSSGDATSPMPEVPNEEDNDMLSFSSVPSVAANGMRMMLSPVARDNISVPVYDATKDVSFNGQYRGDPVATPENPNVYYLSAEVTDLIGMRIDDIALDWSLSTDTQPLTLEFDPEFPMLIKLIATGEVTEQVVLNCECRDYPGVGNSAIISSRAKYASCVINGETYTYSTAVSGSICAGVIFTMPRENDQSGTLKWESNGISFLDAMTFTDGMVKPQVIAVEICNQKGSAGDSSVKRTVELEDGSFPRQSFYWSFESFFLLWDRPHSDTGHPYYDETIAKYSGGDGVADLAKLPPEERSWVTACSFYVRITVTYTNGMTLTLGYYLTFDVDPPVPDTVTVNPDSIVI